MTSGSAPMQWHIRKVISKGEYNYALVPEHPSATKHGYVLEHRIIVENTLGRLLSNKEQVHHIDHNKKNNAPDNLEVLTAKEHHAAHNNGRTFIELTCANCQLVFYRELRQVHKNAKNAFCSRSCNGRFHKRAYRPGLLIQ